MITPESRQYRAFEVRAESDGIVEGYAATFDQPTVLYSYESIDYKEVIDSKAFDKALMADVVMNFNHSGKPVARTKNNTLTLTVDAIGLKIAADLSGTEEGRRLHEEIKGGYIDKMSFAFTVREDGEEYDKSTHTRRITGFDRIYDVAAVDIPAYDSTTISARSFFAVEAEKEIAEAKAAEAARVADETRRKKIKIMLEVAK